MAFNFAFVLEYRQALWLSSLLRQPQQLPFSQGPLTIAKN